MAQRSLQFCGRWTLKVNSLWLWCYCALVLAAEGYLMYRAVSKCRDYNELPWHSSEKPVSELYAYICLIVLSVMCMPFFVITTVFKVGCYANDGTRLGRDNVLHHLNVDSPNNAAAKRGRFLRDIWRHAGPLSQTFHILAAFALLLPKSMVEAQQIKFGFLTPEKIWGAELEVLYGESRYELKSPASDVFGNVTEASYRARTTPIVIEAGPAVVSPEFVNYMLALIIYSLRYAAVYWYTSATFSVCFAASLLLTTLHYAYAYCGMQILYKFAVNEYAVTGINLLLPHGVIMALHILASVISFFSPTALFNYGYCQYVASCRHFLQKHFPTYARYVAKMPIGCHGYVPHIFATTALVFFVAFRSPIVYDYVNVYRATGFPILLTCIILDALYMVLWIALWFVFTLKHTWEFRVNPQMDMLHSLQRAATISAAAASPTAISQDNVSNTQAPPGDSNNNSRDSASGLYSAPQQNSVQVVDRPPAYTSQENVQLTQNHSQNDVKPQRKTKKQLPPLHIDTSEARLAQAGGTKTGYQSPKQQVSPSRQSSPNRHIQANNRQNSPKRHHSPKRQTSPQRQESPHRNIPQKPHSPTGIYATPSHNTQHVSRKDHSPLRTQTPETQVSPGRSAIQHHSPSRQYSYPSTMDSNPPDTPDTLDGTLTPNTPISPASALKKSGLRKSGERRHNVHQRVTFDDSVDHIGDSNSKLNNLSQLSPNSLRQRKKSINLDDSHAATNGDIPLQTLNAYPLTATTNLPTPAAFTGSTPENTLTRNYRSSIRDKCGEYYKHIGDIGIPPAAQSSPVPHAQPRPLSDNLDNRELILSPLAMVEKQQSHLAASQQTQPNSQHQRLTSEAELTGYYELGRAREQHGRRPPGGRKLLGGEDDRHYSFPPQLKSQPPSRPPVQSDYKSNHTNYTNHMHFDQRQSDASHMGTNQHKMKPSLDQQPSRDLSGHTRDNKKHLRDLSREIARDLNKQFTPINTPHSYLHTPLSNRDKTNTSSRPELNREIKIIKPELNRRDSALPSSNETSSNDSAENMLCSQV